MIKYFITFPPALRSIFLFCHPEPGEGQNKKDAAAIRANNYDLIS